ncbi:MAG: HEAT repeat domain-containing protein [Candidatus Brocadiia bacterium]
MENQLKSPNPSARQKALNKLRLDPYPELREAIEGRLVRDTDVKARAMAAEALGNLGSTESLDKLRLLARRDISWVVRKQALAAIVKIEGPEAENLIRYAIARDSSPQVRIEALQQAHRVLPGEKGAEVFLMGLKDQNEAVKLTAHRLLENATDKKIPPEHVRRWEKALENSN